MTARVVGALVLCGLGAVATMATMAAVLGWLDARELDETDGVLPGTVAHVAARMR